MKFHTVILYAVAAVMAEQSAESNENLMGLFDPKLLATSDGTIYITAPVEQYLSWGKGDGMIPADQVSIASQAYVSLMKEYDGKVPLALMAGGQEANEVPQTEAPEADIAAEIATADAAWAPPAPADDASPSAPIATASAIAQETAQETVEASPIQQSSAEIPLLSTSHPITTGEIPEAIPPYTGAMARAQVALGAALVAAAGLLV